MSEEAKKRIADEADMIVGGYSFTRGDGCISVVNLNLPNPTVLIMNEAGKMLESSMNPIDQVIVQKIWKKDSKFMEAAVSA